MELTNGENGHLKVCKYNERRKEFMINIEVPFRIEEKISEKTGNKYMMISLKVDEDYTLRLFPNQEQQMILRNALKNSNQKIKLDTNKE